VDQVRLKQLVGQLQVVGQLRVVVGQVQVVEQVQVVDQVEVVVGQVNAGDVVDWWEGLMRRCS